MTETIWSVLLAVAVTEALILAIVMPFVGEGRARIANRVLACVSLDLAVDLGWFLLLVTGNAAQFPYLVGVPTPFLLGPLYYLYSCYVLEPHFRLRPWYSLHAIPAVVMVIRNWSTYTATTERKVAYLESLPGAAHTVEPAALLPLVMHVVQILAYVVVVDRMAARRRSDLAHANGPEHVDRVVFFRLINFSFLLFVVVGSVICGYILVTRRFVLEMDYILVLTMGLVVSAVVFSAVTQPRSLLVSIGGALGARGPKVPQAVIEQVHAELLNCMEKERAYLQRNLKIGELARQMGVPQYHISETLSTVIQSNFNDFVNRYRVREAERLLVEDRVGAYTYSAIAADVGFTSRASFYRAFKRVTGTTPTEYVRATRSR